ncbi:MAG: sodium-dependent transporter [Chitinophagales bacterium]|nr:sodium-dependent transporter [Chitinophagales bacterium]MDW8417976.1 sodium-dependent transporter [Chitinophagales bacterium]
MSNKESWGTRVGLILAMAGNAVGLGNFLRFPVQAIKNGGGAFIIPYLVCFLLMGIPLLLIEWSIGRYGGKRGHHATPFILGSMHRSKIWMYLGVFGIFTNLGVAAYYCYIESWTLAYIYHSLAGTFSGKNPEQVASVFGEYVSLKNYVPIVFWIICLLINTYILSRGLSGGVEAAAKVGMPLLLVFGAFLAIRGVTLKAGSHGAVWDGTVGLNFLWTPDFTTIWSPKVWLAAAGQIFFTLSVGLGSIQCYASYVKSKDDIALNAMSAGWMNEFVEVVLGSSILIPISIGYLGVERVVELTQSGGLGLGFKTLPYLFQQWGPVLAALAGVMWFGLLFFAGITSSLAMGTPWMGFMQDEFDWSREKGAWTFGVLVLLLGLPCVIFFNEGVFDEFDYWAGTVSLVILALAEVVLFAWVFGIEKGWREINEGADIRIPSAYKYIIKYITPLLLGAVFIGSLPNIYATLMHTETKEKIRYIQNPNALKEEIASLQASLATLDSVTVYQLPLAKLQSLPDKQENTILTLRNQLALYQNITAPGFDAQREIAALKKSIAFKNISRALLVLLFAGISYLVYRAYQKRVVSGETL